MDIFIEPNPFMFLEGHGMYFLGLGIPAMKYEIINEQGKHIWIPLGVKPEKHAITIAASRSGKGVAVIIPNLKLWTENVLVIDPKGEAAEITAAHRETMGQSVYVIDPFRWSKVDEKYRASYNPLDELDIESITIREDINVIAEGLMMRHDPKHGRWDNKAKSIISGVIAYVKTQAPEDKKNLIEVRNILITSDLDVVASDMMNYSECGGLMKTAAQAIQSPDGKDFIDTAQANTEWLDTEAFKDCLCSSDFSLSDLKTKPVSLFLVLPPDYLDEHGRFLRLFVRNALSAMGKRSASGNLLEKRCLFLLDEFYSIGHLKQIQTASGQMPGMGVHLWPILQDIGQLYELYGRDGANTFFANADFQQFFGANDPVTLEYISTQMGNQTMNNLPQERESYFMEGSVLTPEVHEADKVVYRHSQEDKARVEKNYDQMISRNLGKPRMSPDEVANLIKKDKNKTADFSIVFVSGMRRLKVALIPYWNMDANIIDWTGTKTMDIVRAIEKPAQPKQVETEKKRSFLSKLFFG